MCTTIRNIHSVCLLLRKNWFLKHKIQDFLNVGLTKFQAYQLFQMWIIIWSYVNISFKK